MAKKYYHKQTYPVEATTGEAQALFGKVTAKTKTKPTIKILIGKNNSVTFKVKNAMPAPGRNFAKEATAEFIQYGVPTDWPTQDQDLIIGHINYGSHPADQQLFLMWVREEPSDPGGKLKGVLNFFFFKSGVRYSNGWGPTMFGGTKVGQDNGGGTGHGPN